MADRYDPAFDEEKKNLENVEIQLDAEIRVHTGNAQRYIDELSDSWSTGDSDSIANRKWLAECRDSELAEAAQYREFKPQPYFGHMDFDVSEGEAARPYPDVCYIGKHDIYNSDRRHIVIDWRSPVGTFFYQKTQKEFEINGFKYTLMLRRALEIQDGRLIGCETEYDGADVTLDGDVIDPFLRTVLLDKRRQKRLTDIIRTIQGNQNSIIRRPFGESFAVQGCAGSGKTMILLHRLSYLLYNQPRIALESIKVITPNKYFDEHISDLSRELGLDKIERFSVEEYYCRLIKLYSGTDRKVSTVESEKSLNEAMLAEIYSKEFTAAIESAYAEYWDAGLNSLLSAGLKRAMSFFGIPIPDTISRGFDAFSLLSGYIRRMSAQLADTRKEYNETLESIENAKKQTESLKKRMDEEEQHLISVLEAADSKITGAVNKALETASKYKIAAAENEHSIEELDGRLSGCRVRNEQLRTQIISIRRRRAALVDAKSYIGGKPENSAEAELILRTNSGILDKLNENEQAIQERSSELEKMLSAHPELGRAASPMFSLDSTQKALYSDYTSFISQPENDPVRAMLTPKLRGVLDAVIQAQREFDATPKYNFVRRNRSKAALDKAMQDFSAAAGDAIREYEHEINEGILKLGAQKNQIEASIAGLRSEREGLFLKFTSQADTALEGVIKRFETARLASDAELNRLSRQKEQQTKLLEENKKASAEELASVIALRTAREQLESRRSVDEAVIKKLPAGAGKAAAELNRVFEAVLNYARMLENNIDSIPENEEKLKGLKSKLPDESIEASLAKLAKEADKLSAASVVEEVVSSALKQVYEKYNQKHSRYTYRHKLYLMLLFAVLYYRRPAIPDGFLNIDEAQDISVVEYNLLARILGPRCCYNLYGDVNQAVYSFKGIEVWEEDIPMIVRGNVYMLNENYRNTLQITDYCNRVVGSEMTAIGINGEDVAELSLIDAAARIASLKKANPASRSAVIYRHGAEGVLEKLKNALDKYDCAWSGVDAGRVSVISTEMAKGLEFEYVVAVTPGMSENERYVAFTRALDTLITVNAL